MTCHFLTEAEIFALSIGKKRIRSISGLSDANKKMENLLSLSKLGKVSKSVYITVLGTQMNLKFKMLPFSFLFNKRLNINLALKTTMANIGVIYLFSNRKEGIIQSKVQKLPLEYSQD